MYAVTHNGTFHADDVFAAAVVQLAYPGIIIKRTRDPHVIAEADIVFDVGAQDDHVSNRFDHHQHGGAGQRDNGVKYAAFGLVWKKFGQSLVSEEVAMMVDERLVQTVDLGDNGQAPALAQLPIGSINIYSVSTVISSFNSSWNECTSSDVAFQKAVVFALDILDRAIIMAEGEIEAREGVRLAMYKCTGPFVVLDVFCPWQQVIIEESDATFVVFPAETGDTWMVQCVPTEVGSFDKRRPLPAAWGGLRDSDLAEITNVADAVFCHPGLFICGAKSRQGAIELAKLAIG